MNELRRLRLNKGITVEELSLATNVPEATIYNVERGDTIQPRMKTLTALAEFFDVQAGDLVAVLAPKDVAA